MAKSAFQPSFLPHSPRIRVYKCQVKCSAQPAKSAVASKKARGKHAQCISEVACGDDFFGTVVCNGPAKSIWLDIGVVTKGGKPIRARLRHDRKMQKATSEDIAGTLIPVHAHRVQPDSGRVEVRKGLKIYRDEAPQNVRGIDTVTVGEGLRGVVIAVGTYGTVVDVGISRVSHKLNRTSCYGLLQRKHFKSDWASEADTIRKSDTSRVISLGDEVEVWVRKAHSENAFLLLDANIVEKSRVDLERTTHLRLIRKRRKGRHMDSYEKGERHTGVITNITHYGVFVDIGARKNVLIHYSRMTEEHKWDWKGFKLGSILLVEIHDIKDDQLLMQLIGVKDEDMKEVNEIISSPFARVREVERAKELGRMYKSAPANKKSTPFEEANDAKLSEDAGEEFEDEKSSGQTEKAEDEEAEESEKFSDDYFEDKYGFY